ncbi:MAG TPA: endolytic transglycosylase MltG [Casimicrobiaceae bacterium]|nr:endolytic transglycosylase MltG [Casimicrobiaceae bacterium]
MPGFSFLRYLLRTAFSLAVVLAVAAAALWWWLDRPLAFPASPYPLEVRSGASLASVARKLADDGVIAHPWLLTGLARARGVDRSIKAGQYEFEGTLDLAGLLARLTAGDVTQSAITFVEGSTAAELLRRLASEPTVGHGLAGRSQAEIAAVLAIDAPSLEGQFFPDTYFYAAGSADRTVLARAHRTLKERLDAAWTRRAPDLPFATPYEALILASIVEKETGRPADRPMIASVFVNRLKRGMRLQTDPTVIYGLGDAFDGNLRKRDLETDTPYNTYTRDGLPPTPIALPSQAALDAVVDPPASPYLYFVARGDGTSEFSATLADHNRAVAKYQKAPK